jgi:hypothetical protein
MHATEDSKAPAHHRRDRVGEYMLQLPSLTHPEECPQVSHVAVHPPLVLAHEGL